MTVRVYNTLSRRVEEFKPFKEPEVRVYVCGLTVYDFMHIGHARTYLAFDSILRYLKYRGYRVHYVQNITDIDDKIIRRAKEKDADPLALAAGYAEAAQQDRAKLGLLEADDYPKVSEHIPEVIAAVQKLVAGGHAYAADGSVYFDVASYPDYGRLSQQDTEQLNKHRIEPDPCKESPLDFALWKKAEEGGLGFPSPWGRGRPGWHIECSVMSQKYLGDQFDIHGGALDLVFPHHENERAQSEALTGRAPFVKYWLHTGFLNSSGEKMSKSLGNIISVREFLREFSSEALRLFVLQTHYRSPVDYSRDKVAASEVAVQRLRNFRSELARALSSAGEVGGHVVRGVFEELRQSFFDVMDDDFNTPKAVAALFDAVRQANAVLAEGRESRDSIAVALAVFDELTVVFGFSFSSAELELTREEKELLEERGRLRALRKWAEADKMRDMLLARGLRLVDKSDGTTSVART